MLQSLLRCAGASNSLCREEIGGGLALGIYLRMYGRTLEQQKENPCDRKIFAAPESREHERAQLLVHR